MSCFDLPGKEVVEEYDVGVLKADAFFYIMWSLEFETSTLTPPFLKGNKVYANFCLFGGGASEKLKD